MQKMMELVPENAPVIMAAFIPRFIETLQRECGTSEEVVQERFQYYHEASGEQPGPDGLRKVAAYFVGFCNPSSDGRYYYSLDIQKTLVVVTYMVGCARAIESAAVQIAESL